MKLSKLTLMAAMAAVVMTLSCCVNKTEGNKESQDQEPVSPVPSPTLVYIQPLNTYSAADAKKIGMKIEQITAGISKPIEAEILPAVQLGNEFKNEAGTRYRADKILSWLKKGPKPVIALINDDISCTYKDRADWGVLGLSYLGGDVCVVSTYRVKDKRDFWKVVYHEFGHGHYGLPHCPADDPTCIMQDAKGHPKFGPKTEICDSCWHSRNIHAKR